jgi:hypothetical protein
VLLLEDSDVEDDAEQPEMKSPPGPAAGTASVTAVCHNDGGAQQQVVNVTKPMNGEGQNLPGLGVTGRPHRATAAADVPEGVLQARQPHCDNVNAVAGGAAAAAAADNSGKLDKSQGSFQGGNEAHGLGNRGGNLLQSQVAEYDLSAVVRHKGPLASSGHFVADVKNSKVRGGQGVAWEGRHGDVAG